ncbi:MAG: S8 family serine peptidase [Phycisphaerae bacterium]
MRRVILASLVVLVSIQWVSADERAPAISAAEALGLSGPPIDCGDGTWFLGAGTAPTQLHIPHPANANAADTTNADQLRSGGGLGLSLSGQGVTVGIWDGNAVRATHQEFGGRVTVVDAVSAANHATHVAGTIGAAGVVASAQGMAPSVSIRSREWTNDVAEMAADASLIQISSHSYSFTRGWTVMNWGSGSEDTWYADRSTYSTEDPYFGKYDSSSQALDQVLHDNPKLLSVWAASNDRGDAYQNLSGNNTYVTYLSAGPSGSGWYRVPTTSYSAPPSDGNGGTGYDCLPQDQVAKNTLTVGSVLDHTVDPHDPATITTNSFSSYGPTDDGRIKPDVVGNGNSLYSSLASTDSSYGSMSGTSMAAPNVTGSIALLVEHYRNKNSGTTANSATLKALVLHSATDAGNTGPDYAYGWGLMNAAEAAACITGAVDDPPSERLA